MKSNSKVSRKKSKVSRKKSKVSRKNRIKGGSASEGNIDTKSQNLQNNNLIRFLLQDLDGVNIDSPEIQRLFKRENNNSKIYYNFKNIYGMMISIMNDESKGSWYERKLLVEFNLNFILKQISDELYEIIGDLNEATLEGNVRIDKNFKRINYLLKTLSTMYKYNWVKEVNNYANSVMAFIEAYIKEKSNILFEIICRGFLFGESWYVAELYLLGYTDKEIDDKLEYLVMNRITVFTNCDNEKIKENIYKWIIDDQDNLISKLLESENFEQNGKFEILKLRQDLIKNERIFYFG